MPAFFPPGIVSTTGLVDPGGGADPDGGVEPGPSRAGPGGADSWSPLPSVTFPVQNNTESLYRQCMAELSLQQCRGGYRYQYTLKNNLTRRSYNHFRQTKFEKSFRWKNAVCTKRPARI